MDIVDYFNFRLFTSIIQMPTQYFDNPNDSNSVIDLMFLQANSLKIEKHFILSDLHSPSDYAFLTVDIIIEEEFIQDKQRTIIKNSEEEEKF